MVQRVQGKEQSEGDGVVPLFPIPLVEVVTPPVKGPCSAWT